VPVRGEVGDVGGLLLLVYVEPFADRVTHSAWTYVLLPVPPRPVEHATTNSLVPPLLTFVPSAMIWPILPRSDPLNALVTLVTVGEALVAMLPSAFSAYRTADTWKPAGHPFVVDQVGVKVVAPLGGWKLRLPGSVPVTASAAVAVSSPAPAVNPSAPRSTSHLTFASRRESRTGRITDIAAHDMAQTANSRRTSGEK
jgi:hypothetical protein